MEQEKTLGGFQHLETGWTQEGDVWVSGGKIKGAVKPPFIGLHVHEAEHRVGYNVYRQMAVCKQGDNDPSWKGVDGLAGADRINTPEGPSGSNGPIGTHVTTSKAATHDDGKPPLANLPWAGVREVAMVQAYGHSKYKDFNNFRKGMEVSRNLSCAIRHISEYMDGNDLDSESGRNHLAHAACRLLFVLQNLHDGTAIDDRYKGTK
jgi:hypothetical protein